MLECQLEFLTPPRSRECAFSVRVWIQAEAVVPWFGELLFDKGETGACQLLLWVVRGDKNLGCLNFALDETIRHTDDLSPFGWIGCVIFCLNVWMTCRVGSCFVDAWIEGGEIIVMNVLSRFTMGDSRLDSSTKKASRGSNRVMMFNCFT